MMTLVKVPSFADKAVSESMRTARVVMIVFMSGLIQKEIAGEVDRECRSTDALPA